MVPSGLFFNRPTSASIALLLHLKHEMLRIDAQLEAPLTPGELADPASVAIAGVHRSGLDALHMHYAREAKKVARGLLRSRSGRLALRNAGVAGATPMQIVMGVDAPPQVGTHQDLPDFDAAFA